MEDSVPRHFQSRQGPLAQCEKLRGFGGSAPKVRGLPDAGGSGDAARRAKKQITHRLPPEFVRQILKDFNAGSLDALSAADRLGVCRARLYQLRTDYLKNKSGYQPAASGGDRREAWPPEVIAFLTGFLPVQSPPNYQLVADEMERLCNFKRARATVESYVKTNLSHLVPTPPPKKRTYRRFRRAQSANSGNMTARSTSGGQPLKNKPCCSPSMTVPACMLPGRFVERDTTWNHFLHFREAFERHGLPEAIYTDALSLFGPSSSNYHADPRSEFQRALRALHVAHLVAPTPQAKGKIERRFQTFQNRLVTLLAHAGVSNWESADPILQMEIQRQSRKILRTTDKIPCRSLGRAVAQAHGPPEPDTRTILARSAPLAACNAQGPYRPLHRI